MTTFYVKGTDGAVGSGTHRGPWAASQNYSVGDRVVANRSYTKGNACKYVYECTTDSGSSGASQPTWGTTPGGTTSDSGITWTCREATSVSDAHYYLDYLVSLRCAAGDRVYVDASYSVTLPASGNWDADFSCAGTESAPIEVLCVTDLSSPTTLATTALFGTANYYGQMFLGAGFLYIYGVTLYSGNNFTVGYCQTTGGVTIFDNCLIRIADGASSTDTFKLGANDPYQTRTVLLNTNIQSDKTGWSFGGTCGIFEMYGGAFTGSAPSTALIYPTSESRYMTKWRFVGVNLSGVVSALFRGTTRRGPTDMLFENCRLGSGVALFSSTKAYRNGHVLRLHNCDSGTKNYRYALDTFDGSIVTETTLIRTGGSSDGTTGYSLKAVTENSSFNFSLTSEPIAVWNESTGSSMTATVEILHDSATALKDDEVWAEVEYLGSASYPVASFASDRKTNILATGANQDSSSETWTTTGMSNPNKQKLVVTFTPQMKGYVKLCVCVAKNSYTVYIDPKITLS